jgi:hypothetical protein
MNVEISRCSRRVRAMIFLAAHAFAVPACQYYEGDDSSSRKQQAGVMAPAEVTPGVEAARPPWPGHEPGRRAPGA